jgi:hypothetical protein
MKKMYLGFIAFLVIAAVAVWNVNFNMYNSHLSMSLSDIESLSAESCTNIPSSNTGVCKGNVGSPGVSCVTPSIFDPKDCNGVSSD